MLTPLSFLAKSAPSQTLFINQTAIYIHHTTMKPTVQKSLIAGAFLLSAVAAQAALPIIAYSQNFDSFPNNTNALGDGSSINQSGASPAFAASVQGGALRLTNDAFTGEQSSFILPNVPAAAGGWMLTFNITIIDADPGANPADGMSINYGALTGSLSGNAAGSEHGWTQTDSHIAYQIDTWENGNVDNGLRIANYATGSEVLVAAQQGIILNDNTTVNGAVTLSWDPVNGASMNTTGFVTNVNFVNVATPGFSGNPAHLFAFAARTGFAEETLLLDNVVLSVVPESSSSLLTVLAGLGLMSIRRRK